jgi:GxxExxY protein
MTENEIGRMIVNCAFKVHQGLGPGLLESTYEACLKYELEAAGLRVELQKSLPVIYKEIRLDCGYRIDLLVEQKVIVEIKSIESLSGVHMAQVITYLRLSDCKLGYLINFNVRYIKYGIKKVVNNLV